MNNDLWVAGRGDSQAEIKDEGAGQTRRPPCLPDDGFEVDGRLEGRRLSGGGGRRQSSVDTLRQNSPPSPWSGSASEAFLPDQI